MTIVTVDDNKSYILDLLINVGSVQRAKVESFFAARKSDVVLNSSRLSEAIDSLKKEKFIVEKDGVLSLEPSHRDGAALEVRNYLDAIHVNSQKLFDMAEKNDFRLPSLLAAVRSNDGRADITFVDKFEDTTVLSVCMDLAADRMAFQHGWDQAGHHYVSFYLRRYPFSVTTTLEELLAKKAKLGELKSLEDLAIVAIVLFSPNPPTMEDLKVNLPDLTTEHLREAVSQLVSEGVVQIKDESLIVDDDLKHLLQSRFIWEHAERLNGVLFESAKQKLYNRTSNLYYLGLVERLLSNKAVQTSTPFFALEKESVSNVLEEDLVQAAKLGIVYLTQKDIVVNTAVAERIESVLKESLRLGAVMTVHAGNVAELNDALLKVFGANSEYVKVEDPNVDEETLRILRNYVKQDSNLMLLTGVRRSEGSSLDKMKENFERLRGRGRGFDVRFVGRAGSGEAPFEKTYVISKTGAFMFSHPLKDFGKSADTFVLVESKARKDGEIEPAFDYLFGSASRDDLGSRGLMRQTLNEWLK